MRRAQPGTMMVQALRGATVDACGFSAMLTSAVIHRRSGPPKINAGPIDSPRQQHVLLMTTHVLISEGALMVICFANRAHLNNVVNVLS